MRIETRIASPTKTTPRKTPPTICALVLTSVAGLTICTTTESQRGAGDGGGAAEREGGQHDGEHRKEDQAEAGRVLERAHHEDRDEQAEDGRAAAFCSHHGRAHQAPSLTLDSRSAYRVTDVSTPSSARRRQSGSSWLRAVWACAHARRSSSGCARAPAWASSASANASGVAATVTACAHVRTPARSGVTVRRPR